MPDPKNLVWIDLEMSGLDPRICTILEIASIVTDAELNVIDHGPSLVIHQDDAVLDAMDEWNTEHHGASGLTQAVRDSTISLADAQAQTLDFLAAHCPPGVSPLCGNSVGNDRAFLEAYMPDLAGFLHYRVIDVSSVKELVKRWYGEEHVPDKKRCHRALEDIEESIEELRHYRRTVFTTP